MKWGRSSQFLGAGLFTLLLIWLGYWGSRDSFIAIFLVYSLLFGLLYGLFSYSNFRDRQVVGWLVFSMLMRILLLAAVPQLSDDYFRFIWDGNLLLSGINPYQYTPAEILPALLLHDPHFFQSLFDNLNSPDYFSVYPPTNQLIFGLASWVGVGDIFYSIIALRLVLIVFECGVLILMWKIAKLIQIEPKQVLLYALNPLVILEITGNLHFEGMMLFFLMLGFYGLLRNKKMFGVWYGMAIAMKLTPLILGPLWISYLRKKQLYLFIALAGISVIILFLPLLGMLPNFLESIRLYYGKFEFNAGIYYLTRFIAMWWIPYNPIAYISPILTGIAGIFIGWIAWKKPLNGLFSNAALTYLVYLLLHTVVHPWYLIVPLGISVFTPYRLFPVWSFVIFLSYSSYIYPETNESAILLLLQYGTIAVVGYWDYRKLIREKIKTLPLNN